jgi:hypothetical protein
VGVQVIIGPEILAQLAQQKLRDLLGRLDALLRERGALVDDLTAHDLVDPGRVDLEAAQLVGDVDRVAADAEVGRRALEHGDVLAVGRHGRQHRGSRGA